MISPRSILVLAAPLAWWLQLPHPAFACPSDPLQFTEVAPPDISVFVHVSNAAQIRRNLAGRPISHWFDSVWTDSAFQNAWSTLAKTAHMGESQLFDRCFGREFSFVSRGSEWALATDVDQNQATAMLQQLRLALREPTAGMAVYDWPEQEILIARDERRLIIAPANHAKLFFELLPRLEARNAHSLAQHPAVREIRGFDAASMALFVQHDDSIGGASAAVAEMQGDRVIIQHAASFERSPFPHDTTNLTCDFSPILGFENRALAAIMQPADVANESVNALLADNLGQNIVNTQLSENLADRRLIVINQVDGRLFEEPDNLMWASMASCLELKHAGPDVKSQVDRHMARVTKQVQQLSHGTLLQDAPAQGRMEVQDFGNADVPANGDQCLSGGFPIMKDVSLAWGVADGPHGSWFVVASHQRSVEEVVGVLEESLPTDQRLVGKFDMCGVGCGDRIQRHLQTWSVAANEFAAEAGSETMKTFGSTLHLMSQLAGGVKCCCWQLSRPSANEMRLDLQIELAPPN